VSARARRDLQHPPVIWGPALGVGHPQGREMGAKVEDQRRGASGGCCGGRFLQTPLREEPEAGGDLSCCSPQACPLNEVPPTPLPGFVFSVGFSLILFTTKTAERHAARPPSQGCPVQNHRIPAWSGLEGTSGGHPAQPPAQAGSPTAGCTAPRPGGS